MHKNATKELLQKGKAALGTFVRSSDPGVVEVLGYSGLDFVVIDNEHASTDALSTVNLIRAAEVAGIVPLVRVPTLEANAILKVLDAGALGIQIPAISSRREAETAVRYAKYAPEGTRGLAVSGRAARHGLMDKTEYLQSANDRVMVICYIENKEAVEAVEDIAQVPGNDVVFAGPFDLSQSYGVPGETRHPVVMAAMKRMIKAAEAAGIAAGTIAANPDEARFWLEQGMRYIAYSSDYGLIAKSLRQDLPLLR